jgi:hypothetical protein
MQMMIETQEMKEAEYTPRHMRPVTIEVQGLEGLRRLVDQLPDGTVYSIDLEVVSDGQET